MLKTLKTEKKRCSGGVFEDAKDFKKIRKSRPKFKIFKIFQFLCYFCQFFNTFWGLERVNGKNSEK